MSQWLYGAPVVRLARGVLLVGLLAGCGNDPRDVGTGRTSASGGEAAGGAADASQPQNAGGAGRASDAGAGGADATSGAGGAGDGSSPVAGPPPYAESVVSFTPGEGAGYNQSKMPSIVLGPPHGKGNDAGSLDVVSLGAGGEIVLGFGDQTIVDGPGPDLIVFENPFWPGGDASQVYAELGEVSVSDDGKLWQTFPCDTVGDGQGHFPGCAGVTPTLIYDPVTLVPLDPAQTGGDAFDLADLHVAHAKFVKIRDLKTLPAAGNSSGFDLDAVGLVHVSVE